MREVYILSATRTAIGAFLGGLKDVPVPKLGAAAIKEAVTRAGIKKEDIDECLMGCVLTGGLGQAPARQAMIFADLPKSVRATTVNRVCGSGLKTIMLGTQMIQTEDAEVVVAGGMENMSRAPFLLDRAREGYRLGNGKLIDSMVNDGLWDPYSQIHMGTCADLCAKEKKFSREEQDRFATLSYKRAISAIESNRFQREIVPVDAPSGKETVKFAKDEEPFRAKLDRFSQLKPAFDKDGTVTVANASSLSDGAAAVVLASADYVKKNNLKPIARVVSQASYAQDPVWFTTAPVGAIKRALDKAGKKPSDMDLYEINEAFAVVALTAMKDLSIDEAKVNVRGGAVALGHPIGASGTRIVTTLIHALQDEKKKYGLATLCIGGGEGSAVVFEVFH